MSWSREFLDVIFILRNYKHRLQLSDRRKKKIITNKTNNLAYHQCFFAIIKRAILREILLHCNVFNHDTNLERKKKRNILQCNIQYILHLKKNYVLQLDTLNHEYAYWWIIIFTYIFTYNFIHITVWRGILMNLWKIMELAAIG